MAPFGGNALAQGSGQLQGVEVIGTTPLPGARQPREEIAAPVQSATAADIDRSGALDASEFMARTMSGVFVNSIQGNPFQPDVNYRGYTASPLLGTPQGLSVYMDGVRLNQPFGDVVSWDLIPRGAIASITLMPGSNPLFGLNTLGGALSIQTKDGKAFPGSSIRVLAGSWGRRTLELEHGGFNDRGLNWYVNGSVFREDGWRVDSPSKLGQLFSKVGWANGRTDVKLTMAYAGNTLNGNGLQEQRLLERQYDSVYTKPDITKQRSWFANLTGQHSIGDSLQLSGNVYYRNIRTDTFNGDINEGALDQNVYQPNANERAALTGAGYTGFPVAGENAANAPFPFWRCIANVLLADEPGEKCNGLINRTRTAQQNYGLAGQLTWLGQLAGHRNQFMAGAGIDFGRMRFTQSTELGYLNPDRSITGLNVFADGVNAGDVDGVPFDNRVDLDGRIRTVSLYAADTVSFYERWHLTVSGRYNRTTVSNRDRITPGGGAGSLDGDHTFSRLNPAIGLTFAPSRRFNAYFGYNEGSRAPTPVELGCADPNNPCKLPNAMAGDPPLAQVVTRTFEAGVRGATTNGLRWNIGVFRAINQNDILFVADDQSGFGYFKNFGRTKRQGIEAGLSGQAGPLSFGTNYTLLDATYQSAESVNGSSNSSNASALGGDPGTEGAITIRPGDRIPLIPRHMFKAWADYQVNAAFSIGASMNALSGVFARGNENNQHQPDGTFYLNSGKTAGWAVFNLSARYRATPQLQLFVLVNNLFDKRHSTAAQLGPTGFTAAGNFIARPLPVSGNGEFPLQHSSFQAPGAPRALWLGLRYSLGKP